MSFISALNGVAIPDHSIPPTNHLIIFARPPLALSWPLCLFSSLPGPDGMQPSPAGLQSPMAAPNHRQPATGGVMPAGGGCRRFGYSATIDRPIHPSSYNFDRVQEVQLVLGTKNRAILEGPFFPPNTLLQSHQTIVFGLLFLSIVGYALMYVPKYTFLTWADLAPSRPGLKPPLPPPEVWSPS